MAQQNDNAILSLVNERITAFVSAFSDNAKRLFVDKNGSLFHAGEFGAYREALTRDFLQGFIPQRMGIDTGFVVSASGKISTQCDIIIYDRSVAPVIQNVNYQRFFPIESVCAVGEVKSKMGLTELKEALRKLSRVKSMRDGLYQPDYVYRAKDRDLNRAYEPQRDERDQIMTFLLCDKFDFVLNEANARKILECYVEEDPQYPANLRHNMVISLKDSLLTYLYPNKQDKVLYQFPVKFTETATSQREEDDEESRFKGMPLKNRFVMPAEGSIEHIRHFLSMMHSGLTAISVLFPDMAKYIPAGEVVANLDIDAIPGFRVGAALPANDSEAS